MGKRMQCEMILDYIKEFGSITAIDAYRDIGCMRLAARISDIRNKGYKIRSEFEESKNRYGVKVMYVRYFLDESA